jgi:hypothetical protein
MLDLAVSRRPSARRGAKAAAAAVREDGSPLYLTGLGHWETRWLDQSVQAQGIACREQTADDPAMRARLTGTIEHLDAAGWR